MAFLMNLLVGITNLDKDRLFILRVKNAEYKRKFTHIRQTGLFALLNAEIVFAKREQAKIILNTKELNKYAEYVAKCLSLPQQESREE